MDLGAVRLKAIAEDSYNKELASDASDGNFAIKCEYIIVTATSGEGGIIEPSRKVEVARGSEQVFTIVPDSCHSIADVVVDGVRVDVDIDEETGIGTYIFTELTSDHRITAFFESSDGEPPSGKLSISNNAKYTNTYSVTLNLSATDECSGAVSGMRFSNDNVNYSPWEDYRVKKDWQLSAGDGEKTVYAQFRDLAENESFPPVSDSIILDTAPPIAGSIVIKNGDEYTNDTLVSLTLAATDSGSGMAVMRFSNDNISYTDPEPYETTKKEWRLSDGNGSKTVYAQFADAAGNWTTEVIKDSINFSAGVDVWPGDTNNDGEVNINDLVPIAEYWGERGSRRDPYDTSWVAQPAKPWEKEEATYADANGDGIVDIDDVNVIDQNWRKTQQHGDTEATVSPGPEVLKAYLVMLFNPAGKEETPVQSYLGQNYPNPFNPMTWIPYQLSEGASVEISIYDINGRLVRTLEVGWKPAGYYLSKERSAQWDGRDQSGDRVCSGVYFYYIQAGEFEDIRKLIITR